MLMAESSMNVCALPIKLFDQIALSIEYEHSYLTLPSRYILEIQSPNIPLVVPNIGLNADRNTYRNFRIYTCIHLHTPLNIYICEYIHIYTYILDSAINNIF
jgi:hypothetical protein